MGRLVLLGGDNSSHTHSVPIFLPQGGNGTLTSGPPLPGRYQNMDATRAWAGKLCSSTQYIQDGISGQWVATNIERWVEKFCHRDVVAEHIGGQSFVFHFLDGWHKKEEFDRFIEARQQGLERTTFIIPMHERDVLREIIEWTEERMTNGHQIVTLEFGMIVHIEDDLQAVEFKLRWSDFLSGGI